MTLYVDDLTERDLATLAGIVGSDPLTLADELRRRPWHIHDLLGAGDVFDAILDRHAHPAAVVSPFLLFAVLIHKTADDLRDATYVNEWIGPRERMPLFDIEPLHEFIEDPGRTSFLAALLASFATPEALPVPAGPFDLQGIALWLEQALPADRAVLFRRLGDLSLFLTGVFPDHTGTNPFTAIEAAQLGKTIGKSPDQMLALCDQSMPASALDALESLGSDWYEASLDQKNAALVVGDVAARFRSARRILNHLADRYLNNIETGWSFAA